jgi:peptidoglycan hydrolase CwlO-like protein
MSILENDLIELKRLATNTYEQDRSNQIHRIIKGIGEIQKNLQALKLENQNLQKNIETLSLEIADLKK